VLNGPIFDAPRSTTRDDGSVVLVVDGKRHPDPTFGGVPIPKAFFKVVACADPEGALLAAGFVMSQEDLLATTARVRGLEELPEERLTAAEARLYQVSIADLARLTQLDFGPLVRADALQRTEALAAPRQVQGLEALRLGAAAGAPTALAPNLAARPVDGAVRRPRTRPAVSAPTRSPARAPRRTSPA
jgi:endonuclease G